VAGDRLRPEAFEGRQGLRLAGGDAAGQADLQRPRHRRCSVLLGIALVSGLGLNGLRRLAALVSRLGLGLICLRFGLIRFGLGLIRFRLGLIRFGLGLIRFRLGLICLSLGLVCLRLGGRGFIGLLRRLFSGWL